MAAVGAHEDGLLLRRHYEGADSWLEIVSAMPRAMFSGALLRATRQGFGGPEVYVDYPGVGGTVHIKARERHLVYRLVAEAPLDVFIGEWPD